MPIYLDTRGHSPISVAICARCGIKFPRDELSYDVNYPGLLCCSYDLDSIDPWRLPARPDDILTFDGPRPDVSLTTQAPSPIFQANKVFGISEVGFARPWQRLTPYALGDSITPQNVDDPAVDLPQNWFLCIVAGTSGSTPPVWPTMPGVIVGNLRGLVSDAFIQLISDNDQYLVADPDASWDGSVAWLNLGPYPV